MAPDGALVPEDTDPEELVLRFRALASPQAFRLAAHLAVGSARLPVMRLVQAAVEERPEPQHLAEVVLSGMLRAHPGADPGAYAFRPGVREVLLGALPRSSLVRTVDLLARVSAEIEARAGALPGEFRALVASLEGRGPDRAAGRPFALVSEECVRLLRGPERRPGGRAPEGGREGVPADSSRGAVPPRLDGDRYEVYERIGGTTAQVWRGYDRYLQRQVALSYFPFPAPDEPVRTGRNGRDQRSAGAEFLAGSYEVARVTAPNLVKVFDAVMLDEGCCLVAELAPGRSLRQRLDEAGGVLPAAEAVSVARSILHGLWALHHGTALIGRGGIPHGNLTPSKVLGVDDGLPRLCHHGLRWPFSPPHDDPDHTAQFPLSLSAPDQASWPGTPRYLAPERQSGPPTPESDLYALGCILLEMLTGSPPVRGPSLQSVLFRHARGIEAAELSLDPELPPELREAVAALLSLHPHRRQRGATLLANLRLPSQLSATTSDYRLLGRPQAWIGGQDVGENAYQSNAFLARLLAARGRVVSEAEMAEAVRERPELRPTQYAHHLKALGIPVRRLTGGYALDVPAQFLDVGRAEARAAEAERLVARGELAAARGKLRAALALWYGPPLAGIVGTWADGERQRLLELRERLEERLASLDRPAETMSPGWLVVEQQTLGPVGVDVLEAVASLLRQAGGGGHVRAQGFRPLLAPIPPESDAVALVEWVVDTFPHRLAELLPLEARRPVRLTVVVHDETEAAATALAGAGRQAHDGPSEAGAGLVVAVLVSHGLRARLPRARRRDFGTITATAGGWRHTVVVEPRAEEPEPAPEPEWERRPGPQVWRPEPDPDPEPGRGGLPGQGAEGAP
ncbi:serine/threonine-protein kinase [Streptomyces showdoensis]|uniref:serine/threonine-protein kinase n=1 Tax=Streptomyces showdoensis TaxID=68268 RepID=UPI0031E790B4